MNRTKIGVLLILAGGLAGTQEISQRERADQKLQAWRRGRIGMLMEDYGELGRYRKANQSVAAPKPGENRVVFFGDSITIGWSLTKSFPQKPYINRGIGGQTTSQLLLRFRQDVVDLRPRVVVILAGTNDIAGNTGPMSLEEIEGNFASMSEIAHANGIRVIFSSVLPVHNYTAASETFYPLRPMPQIQGVNQWLGEYCAKHGDIYLDYYPSMLDSSGYLARKYAEDGLHPNAAGYAVMTPLAEAAIEKALNGTAAEKQRPGN